MDIQPLLANCPTASSMTKSGIPAITNMMQYGNIKAPVHKDAINQLQYYYKLSIENQSDLARNQPAIRWSFCYNAILTPQNRSLSFAHQRLIQGNFKEFENDTWRISFVMSLFPKPLTFFNLLPICIYIKISFCNWNWSKIFKSHKICCYCGLFSFDIFHNVYRVIKSGNEYHAEVDSPDRIKNDFIPLFFLYILWQFAVIIWQKIGYYTVTWLTWTADE